MIFNIYKPKGWTSNDVVQKIKNVRGFKKVGHAGTLDPLAEGVLIILTDSDTKRQAEFMGMSKQYRVKAAFGLASNSHDLGTPVRPIGKGIAQGLTLEILVKTTDNYVGKITQQVPAYSAVHINGQRSYALARRKAGSPLSISLPYKEVEIYDIKICSFKKDDTGEYPITAELLVSCGKGTYIRSLIRDLGDSLGCGAIVTQLIRTKVGEYTVENGLNLESFLKNH